MPKGIYERNLKPTIKAGDKFNYLTAIKFHSKNTAGKQFWFFRCSCGIRKIVCVNNVKNGTTKSCGCLQRKIATKHGMANTKTYNNWHGMKTRCYNKNEKNYKYWGGRGIKVCKRWMKFENFLEDMGECPKGKSLDRKNNDKGYCKENCRWATPKQQANNRRDNIIS